MTGTHPPAPEGGFHAPPPDIKVIALDCDGVMFDTQMANQVYYNHILNRFQLPPMTSEQAAYAYMHTVDRALAYLIGDGATLANAQAYRKQMTYQPFIQHMVMEPYLKPLLRKLKPIFKTAIATNRTDSMRRVLIDYDLQDWFDLVVCALDVQRPKPYPDQLLKILNHFEIEPCQAIYVGDSELDEMAARDAGIRFVAYRNARLSADHHITSLEEIETLLGIHQST
jgi:HAD superfamily hydrolase (TIGR01549 family)